MTEGTIHNMLTHAWKKSEPGFALVSAESVTPEAVRWLWPNWLSLGKLQLLAGSPGTGKTTIAVSLAATVTRGASWPDDGQAAPGDVLIWSGEDGMADTLLPRFLAAGGDRRRLHFVGDVNESGHSRPFNPATDLQRLIDATRYMRDLKLVVLDPVVAVITGDSHKNSETRRDLAPLVSLAEQLDVAVLGITHLSKGTTGREPMERVMGSIAFAAVARVVLATVKARDRKTPHRLVRAKSNLGLDHGGLEYSLMGVPVPGHDFLAQRVEWGQRLDGSAHELMAIEAPDEEEQARAEVMAFLQDQLAGGPVATRELRAAAAANGYKWRTVERAKTDLGVTAKKGVGGLWYWARPAEANPATNPTTGQQHRHSPDSGGVVDGEAERQVRELEESIARQRETVRILGSTGQSTAEAEQLLESMGEALEALKWRLRRK